MALGKPLAPGRPTFWMTVASIALALGADGGCLDIFTLIYLLSPPHPRPPFRRRPDID